MRLRDNYSDQYTSVKPDCGVQVDNPSCSEVAIQADSCKVMCDYQVEIYIRAVQSFREIMMNMTTYFQYLCVALTAVHH